MSHDMSKARQEEVDRNYDAFMKMLPELLTQHRGQHALMKDGKVLGFYSTPQDASSAAETFIPDGLYSIQHVTDAPVDLGYFSHALPLVSV
jgi:hypothetical protein